MSTGQNKKRLELMPGCALAHVCVHVRLALVAGGLFHCVAEFVVQPVARMCLSPCERGDDEVCKAVFCLCAIGRTEINPGSGRSFHGRRSYSLLVPPAELTSCP